MRLGYKLTTIAPLEVKVFMKETSDSLSDADFWWSTKKDFFQKVLTFDPNVWNASKKILNHCFGSENHCIIKQKGKKGLSLTVTNKRKT